MPFCQQHQRRDQKDLQKNPRPGGDKGGGQKERKGVFLGQNPEEKGVDQSQDHPAAQKGKSQREIGKRQLFGEKSIEKAGKEPIRSQFQSHGTGSGKQNRHPQKQTAKQWGDQTNRQSPKGTAKKAAKQKAIEEKQSGNK